MSDTEKLDETSTEAEDTPAREEPEEEIAPQEPEPAPEPAEPEIEDTSPAPEPPPEPVAEVKKNGGGGIAWLALLIALAAAAGAGYGLVDDWRDRDAAAASDRSVADLSGRIRETQQSVSSLEDTISGLSDSDANIESLLGGIQQDIDTRVRMFDSLPARMANLEESVAALQGLSAGARNTLLLAEAEYYMQIANAQLQLAGNPELASMALNMADDRIVQLADPALTEVRRALSDELASLDGMEKPDIEGVTLTLASLSRVVDNLPLRRLEESAGDSVESSEAEESGVGRAWSSVKGAFSGLVSVRKADETERALLSPDSVYFLRANLSLQLEAARLALLRGERVVFEQSLDDADAWLLRYFDASDAQVSSARETIAEIRSGLFKSANPDISGSLKLLRQYQALTESAQ